MKSAKTILFFLLLLTSAFKSNAQISVYSNTSIIGNLHEETSIKECEHCNYQENITLFNRNIKIQIPVMIENGKLQPEKIVEIADKGNQKILKFNAVSDGSSHWLYIQNKGDKLYIIRKLTYNNAIYKKEIKKNDFDYIPATEVCIQNTSEIINKEISYVDLFRFIPANCYKCPIKTDINDCIKNGKIKYSW